VPSPTAGGGGRRAVVSGPITARSAGRFPDGVDTSSNCRDFLVQTVITLATDAAAGANNIKVTGAGDFTAGQTVIIDAGANRETSIIESVGTAGGTTMRTATEMGTNSIPVATTAGFSVGQTVSIDSGSNLETALVASIIRGRGGFGGGAPGSIIIAAPLKMAHAEGVQVSGSGITFTGALTKAHATGASVARDVPTPGAPNVYAQKTP